MSGGTILQNGGDVLLQGIEKFHAAFDFMTDTADWKGTIELEQAQSVQLYVPFAGQVRLDGNVLGGSEYCYDAVNHILTLNLEAGAHEIVVSE
jgi:CRISPR/Cas system-associated exonuclease Cas4 (RecB family)